MKDYSITISVTIPITARTAEQAEERALEVAEWITFAPPNVQSG